MEFREYIFIFKQKLNLFLAVVLAVLVSGFFFQFFRPVRYEAELNLNVTRKGIQETADYRFDDFYRLQADERFADTVVRWLSSERIRLDIQQRIPPGKGTFSLSAKRLSSQLVDVALFSGNREEALAAARAVSEVVNAESEKLDQFQKEKNWFWVIGDEPTVRAAGLGWDKIIFGSLLAGIFFGFWTVLFSHYFSKSDENRD